MTIYGRLGFNFDTTKFNGADALSPNVSNYLANTSINLSTWQLNDMSNSTAGGYYQNPHQSVINSLTTSLNSLLTNSNTTDIDFGSNNDTANTLYLTVTSTKNSLITFTTHTNNLSGLTYSSNSAVYPDLNSGLAVGREILNLTNKTDSIQNNTPILGNFTSLYIGSDLTTYNSYLANDVIILSTSISGNTSSISNEALTLIISHVQGLQSLIVTRYNSDISFYQNSLTISNDYRTVSQFSNIGATQNSLISLIGTSKLKTNLGY
jgi:hypothetical protein